jgi:hypothetical protein
VVVRGPEDLFQDKSFPNYHYVILSIHGKTADATMYRVTGLPSDFSIEVKDKFTLTAP